MKLDAFYENGIFSIPVFHYVDLRQTCLNSEPPLWLWNLRFYYVTLQVFQTHENSLRYEPPLRGYRSFLYPSPLCYPVTKGGQLRMNMGIWEFAWGVIKSWWSEFLILFLGVKKLVNLKPRGKWEVTISLETNHMSIFPFNH